MVVGAKNFAPRYLLFHLSEIKKDSNPPCQNHIERIRIDSELQKF